jgi:hypothetical protein
MAAKYWLPRSVPMAPSFTKHPDVNELASPEQLVDISNLQGFLAGQEVD